MSKELGVNVATDWVNTYDPIDFTDPNTPHNRVLVIVGQKFYVYAEHLSLCSEFFRTMFNSDFKEKNQEEIDIKEVEAEGFHSFLKLLQPYNVNIINESNYRLLVAYSHRFLARETFAICEDFILNNFDKLDKIELLKMSFEYNWMKIKNKLRTLIEPAANKLCNKTSQCNSTNGYYCYGCNLKISGGCDVKKTSFLVANKAAIAELPAEIHSFLLNDLLEKVSRL